jgi:hypothetical protein
MTERGEHLGWLGLDGHGDDGRCRVRHRRTDDRSDRARHRRIGVTP